MDWPRDDERQIHQWSSSARADNPVSRGLVIESARNAWDTDGNYRAAVNKKNDHASSRYADSTLDKLYSSLKSRVFRRYLLIFTTLTICVIGFWMYAIAPRARETQAVLSFREGWLEQTTDASPVVLDAIHIGSLPPQYVPGSSKSRWTERLMFVGDIHGCKKELVKLLEKMNFDAKTDHLVTLGDVINKGPDSLGVVDLLRRMNASCVRGNNEDRVLLEAERLKIMLQSSGNDASEDDGDRELARALDAEQLSYLRSCPVILRVGDVGTSGSEVIAVHAGIVPGLALEKQDPSSVMNMRIIDLTTRVPSKADDAKGSVPWAQLFNKYQKLLPGQHGRYGPSVNAKPREGHTTVIFGHDSKRGLQIRKYTKGLDSGCYKGGQLTALIMDERGMQQIVQVSCEDYTHSS